MISRRFHINLIIRIILILINMMILVIIVRDLFQKQLMFTFIVFIVILVLQIILLFNYLNKTNKLFARFILTISDTDFSSKFGEKHSQTPFKGLNIAFNKILEQYQNVSKEKEKQYFLTQHLIQTIPVGILVFNEEGKITFKNKLGENLLGIKEIYSLKQIANKLPDFYNKLNDIGENGNFVFEIIHESEKKKLSVKQKTFNLYDQHQRLISVHDVSKEIDAGEADAIYRLMRILTHEIMNSLTPINSLTETTAMLMNTTEGEIKPFEEFSEKNYNDIRESIIAIKKRGEGLDHFVNNFRTLTKLPEKLKKESIKVRDLFRAVSRIMNTELSKVNVKIDLENNDLCIMIDVALIEQVLINLITNSLAAISKVEDPRIILKSFRQESSVIIQVIDNGVGIPKNKINDIFIPFYTTKENGSGIGLSLVKQIMRLHNGTIHVQSSSENETIFNLKFL